MTETQRKSGRTTAIILQAFAEANRRRGEWIEVLDHCQRTVEGLHHLADIVRQMAHRLGLNYECCVYLETVEPGWSYPHVRLRWPAEQNTAPIVLESVREQLLQISAYGPTGPGDTTTLAVAMLGILKRLDEQGSNRD